MALLELNTKTNNISMALISCPECGKEISDKAIACPNCGNPINPQTQQEEYLCCPRCGSRELHAEHKGFSGGKALPVLLLLVVLGFLQELLKVETRRLRASNVEKSSKQERLQ